MMYWFLNNVNDSQCELTTRNLVLVMTCVEILPTMWSSSGGSHCVVAVQEDKLSGGKTMCHVVLRLSEGLLGI